MLYESDEQILNILNSGNVFFSKRNQGDQKLPNGEHIYVRVSVRTSFDEQSEPMKVLYLKGKVLFAATQEGGVHEAAIHPGPHSPTIYESIPEEESNYQIDGHFPVPENATPAPLGEIPYKSNQIEINSIKFKKDNKRSLVGSNTIQCIHCDKMFSKNSRLIVHMRKHTGDKPYKCNDCGNAYTQNNTLQRHIRLLCGSERPYKCNQCNKAFKQKSHLQGHIRVHTGERPYKCSQCDKDFPLQGTLKLHMRTHTGEKPYQCNQCDMAFNQLGLLKGHMVKHGADKPYKCDMCGKTFFQSSHLKKHAERHKKHMIGQNAIPDFASVSNKTLRLKKGSKALLGALNTRYPPQERDCHEFESGQAGEKLYQCNQCLKCDKAFINKHELEEHINYYHITKRTGERSYKCKKCEMAFLHNEELMLHMYIHTGEKPFPCSLCDKAFLQNSDLKKHMETHTVIYNLERPFQCNMCDKIFNAKIKLKQHLSTHLIERPYQCSMCDKVFFENSHLEDHIMSIHNGKIIQTREKQNSCNQCNRYFLKNSDLKKHMDKHIDKLKSFNRFDTEHLYEPKIEVEDGDIYFENNYTEPNIEVKEEIIKKNSYADEMGGKQLVQDTMPC